jgi:small subunit ribosomal protein S21
MVNMIINIRGAIEAIHLAASSPFMTGIEKSKITTSGFRALTLSTAIAPFSASAQIVQSVFPSIEERREWRIRGLSSTIRIWMDMTATPERDSSTLFRTRLFNFAHYSDFEWAESIQRTIGIQFDEERSTYEVNSWVYALGSGGEVMSLAEVRLQEGESLENALRRFKRKVQQEDIIKEVRRHSFYLKPGEKKRVKEALARKRARKKSRKESDWVAI